MTEARKQRYIKKIIKKRAIHERNKEQTKAEPRGQQGRSIHRPIQVQNSTQKQCSYFYHWKTTTKKPFSIMHKKTKSKGHKSYRQFSRNLERKNKKTAHIMLY